MEAAFTLERYTTEARLPPGHPAIGGTVAALEAQGDGEAGIATILRERFRRYPASPDFRLKAEDVLLLDGEPTPWSASWPAPGSPWPGPRPPPNPW